MSSAVVQVAAEHGAESRPLPALQRLLPPEQPSAKDEPLSAIVRPAERPPPTQCV
jgi:hypothetical protein